MVSRQCGCICGHVALVPFITKPVMVESPQHTPHDTGHAAVTVSPWSACTHAPMVASCGQFEVSPPMVKVGSRTSTQAGPAGDGGSPGGGAGGKGGAGGDGGTCGGTGGTGGGAGGDGPVLSPQMTKPPCVIVKSANHRIVSPATMTTFAGPTVPL